MAEMTRPRWLMLGSGIVIVIESFLIVIGFLSSNPTFLVFVYYPWVGFFILGVFCEIIIHFASEDNERR
ncbi:MAG: hypothetical protein ACW98Y_01820 [Candidatus Thorarchaeota archaeon]|jgi:hypothetical protein